MIRCSEMLLKSGLDRNGPARHTAPGEACLCRGDAGRSREGTSGRRREGDSHHLGSHHLGAVSGAFPVNQRGRRWFIWRFLHPGRRVRRPDTDLSTPPRLGCTPRRPFRSSGEGTRRRRGQSSFGPAPPRRPKPRRGQSSFRQSPFRHGVRGIPSQPTRSTVVHLEVFTSRATHASPRHGFIDPTGPGMPRRRPFRSSGEGTVII